MLYIVGFGCDQKYPVIRYFAVHLYFLCGFIIVHSYCSSVEHRAFLKLFHLVLHKASHFATFQLSPAFCSSQILSRFSLSTPHPCTLSVSVQCMSFYCTLWFMQCMANLVPFSLLYLLFSRRLIFLFNNSSFEIVTAYMTFKYLQASVYKYWD